MNLQLDFLSNAWSERQEDRLPSREFVDFDREAGKVHLKSQFIINGVCVVWKGWLDLQVRSFVICFDQWLLLILEQSDSEDKLNLVI